MRNLDQIQERPSGPPTAPYVALWAIGLVALVGVILAIAASIPASSQPERHEDPFEALRVVAQTPKAAAGQPTQASGPSVDPSRLTFPQTLSGASESEIAAVVAAASAEYAHPDALIPSSAKLPDLAAELPAAVVAGNREELGALHIVERKDAATAPTRLEATAGAEGAYVLQVLSYDKPVDAHTFAKTLRRRGHRAYVQAAQSESLGAQWRVRIGPFADRREANRYAALFERDEGIHPHVIRKRDNP